MHQYPLACVPCSHTPRNRDGLGWMVISAIQHIEQRAARHVLRHQEGLSGEIACPVEEDNVAMVQAAQKLHGANVNNDGEQLNKSMITLVCTFISLVNSEMAC